MELKYFEGNDGLSDNYYMKFLEDLRAFAAKTFNFI